MTTIIAVNGLLAGIIAVASVSLFGRLSKSASTRLALWYAALVLVVCAGPLSLLLAAPQITVPPASRTGWTLPWLPEIWAVITMAAVCRLAVALYRSRRLLVTANENERIAAIASTVSRELRNGRQFRTCVGDSVRSARFVGLWQPTILIPRSWANLDEDQIRAILLHEVAHVRRYDDWLIAAEELAKALLFFNPAVVLICRRVSLERELTCDALAASRVSASRYAAVLLNVAKETQAALALAIGSGDLPGRIVALLEARRPTRRSEFAAVAATVGALLAAGWFCLPLAARRATSAVSPTAAQRDGLTSSTTTYADPREPLPLELAAEHFVNGRSMLSVGKYQAAIASLSLSRQSGYETSASAYNIAVAYERMGDDASAQIWNSIARRDGGLTYSPPPMGLSGPVR